MRIQVTITEDNGTSYFYEVNPKLFSEKEINLNSITQGSQEHHGCQAISQVYFRKGARWMLDLFLVKK